ncbi:phosphoribosyl-ATP diphosphatase [bacterium]|nr:MAG: phosphoribosyl-ATP diphosphatase [bacterium]
MKPNVIDAIYGIIEERKANPKENSYVCKLLEKGEDKILQKVGEEAVEVILAAKSGDEKALVCEMADLVFHCLVLLGSRGISPEEVEAELHRRFGISGIEEKNSRKK